MKLAVFKIWLIVVFVGVAANVFSQTYSVGRKGNSVESWVGKTCGTEYVLTITTNSNWEKLVEIKDVNGSLRGGENGVWSIADPNSLGVGFLNWGKNYWGKNAATSNNTTLYIKINSSSKTITWYDAVNAPTCPPPPPALTAATNVSVDAPFTVIYPTDDTWRSKITSITVNETELEEKAYDITTSGEITFDPSESTLLQTDVSKTIIVKATGYADTKVTQSVKYGVKAKLAITQQPTAPNENGCNLGTMPIVEIQDKYGNPTADTDPVTARVAAGTWTINTEANSKSAVIGIANFLGLTATSSAGVTDASIEFTAAGVTSVTSNTFDIPAPPTIRLEAVTAISNSEIAQFDTDKKLLAFKINVTGAATKLEQLVFNTNLGYASTDVTKFTLYHSTSDNFVSAASKGSITNNLGPGSHLFSSLNQALSTGYHYFWITVDVSANATQDNTIQVAEIDGSDLTFSACNPIVNAASIANGPARKINEVDKITYYTVCGFTNSWGNSANWATTDGVSEKNSTGKCPQQELINDSIVIRHAVTATDELTTRSGVTVLSGATLTLNNDVNIGGVLTVKNGGALTINPDKEINAKIVVEAGGTINWPEGILKIGAKAHIIYNGNISADKTDLRYQDDYIDKDAAKITATGTMKFKTVMPQHDAEGKGGSLKASSIKITDEHGNVNSEQFHMYYYGPTTIKKYTKGGNVYFEKGTLTINEKGINTKDNEFKSLDNSSIVFNSKVRSESSVKIRIDVGTGNATFNVPNGDDKGKSADDAVIFIKSNSELRVIARETRTCGLIYGDGGSNMFFEGNVVQNCKTKVFTNNNAAIYVKGNWDSNGEATEFTTFDGKFKIEGNAHFDNIIKSGNGNEVLNAGSQFIVLGDAYMKGDNFGKIVGDFYVGKRLKLDKLQLNFHENGHGYVAITSAADEFKESKDANGESFYDVENNTWSGDYSIGGPGYHLRDQDNERVVDPGDGIYMSKAGGQITTPTDKFDDIIKDVEDAPNGGVDVEPENWESALPITLSEFYAMPAFDKYIEIFWATESEENNDYFTLYRSANGRYFNEVAKEYGAGNSSIINRYSYLDYDATNGINYYKLGQTDYNGTESLSEIISVEKAYKSFELVNVFSRSGITALKVEFADDNVNVLSIIDMQGNIIYEQFYEDVTQARIYLNLNKGLYVLKNTSSADNDQTKFIVR